MSNEMPREEEAPKASATILRPGEPMGVAMALSVCVAGWLIPGAGHLLLRRWGRGAVFALAVLLMFTLGLAMNGRLYGLPPEQPLHILAFFANFGAGLTYMLAQRMGYGVGLLSSPSYDYGTTYLWVAGLLNYLIVLDAFDVARKRKP